MSAKISEVSKIVSAAAASLYLNFPGHGEDDNLVRDAFGAQAYARLQEIKRKYDPIYFA